MLSVVGNAWQRVVMVEEVDRSQLMGLVSTVLKLKKCWEIGLGDDQLYVEADVDVHVMKE